MRKILFKGDFTKAIELYRQYLKSGDNANELIKSLKDDFEYFRNAGFDHSVTKKGKRDTFSIGSIKNKSENVYANLIYQQNLYII